MENPIPFSERERQVIELLLLGKSNKQIALALGVSVRAVEFHLSNIYSKLEVSSRTEAALKLSELRLWESTGAVLRESTVVEVGDAKDNVSASISTWRSPVSKSSLIGLAILVATTLFFIGSIYQMMKERSEALDAVSEFPSIPIESVIDPTETSTPRISSKEYVIEQIRQLVVEYEQTVQAEKKNGVVEYSADPNTGEEVFLFQGDSYMRVWTRYVETTEQVNRLTELYAQLYRDEISPTPFPTQVSPEQNEAYLNQLYKQGETFCPAITPEPVDATVAIYDPDDGKYHTVIIDEALARCLIYGRMIEEWRNTPMLAQVNHGADVDLIRQAMGKPELKLIFQAITELANASWRSAAVYTDETGTRYFVDVEAFRLVTIEANLPGHLNVSTAEKKSVDILRDIAREFAFTNSPRLGELESVLLYEENCKGSICFFRWDYRNNDWTGTDWIMMPPFLQVGVLENGQIVTYINTLDLFE